MDEEKEYPFCLICKRKLTDPESKKLGYGPKCYSRFLKKQRKRYNVFTKSVREANIKAGLI